MRALAFLSLSLLAGCMGAAQMGAGSPDGATEDDAGKASNADAGGTQSGSDAGTPSDAGGSTDSGVPSDAGTPPTDAGRTVPIFVAQGMMGRSMVSCDDGNTWVGNKAWDTDADPLVCGSSAPVTCWMGTEGYDVAGSGQCQSYTPCIDSPDVAKGVAYANGTFVATWGWGPQGVIRQSSNGIDWTTTNTGSPFGGIAFGAGRFVVASRSPLWSADGAQWTASQTADFRTPDGGILWSVRRFAFAPYQGGRFVAVSDGVILISSDGGNTWHPPTVAPQFGGAVSDYGDILYGNGILVIIDDAGTVNVSTDGGDTWTAYQTGVTQILSRGIWTGSEFWIWANGVRLSSPDGKTWTQTPLVGQTWIEGVVAQSPLTGTLVAVQNEWNGYGQQSLLRSNDGVNWTSLPSGAFVPSHPIWSITFGNAQPSTACP